MERRIITSPAWKSNNTDSKGCDQCWQLVLDGEDILVKAVNIQAPVFTSATGLNPPTNSNTIFLLKRCYVYVDEAGVALITAG